MNARYIVVIVVAMSVGGVVVTTQSTLTPERGVDNVFYGNWSDFMSQEVAVGDFDGDGKDDIVTTLMWDDPTTCPPGVTEYYSAATACANGWTSWITSKPGYPALRICRHSDPNLAALQQQHWEDCGYTLTPNACDECIVARFDIENQGAAYVFKGGDWSGKSHDINLATGSGADHMVVGNAAGDLMYNGIAVGDVNNDGYDELILNKLSGRGEVYVIGGDSPSEPWPSMASGTISPPSDPLVDYHFKGRDNGDAFGLGITTGDLNADSKADIIVAVPKGDGPANGTTDSGEIIIFYSTGALPAAVDLNGKADSDFTSPSGAVSSYAQVIWGAAAGDETGVTLLQDRHEHDGSLNGNYEPTSLAIGDWNGDGYKDLAIGAGKAMSGDGVAYVIFGDDPNVATRKLRPGKQLFLGNAVGTSDGPDVKILGKDNSRLGAGLAFLDADVQGPPPSLGGGGGTGKDDLVIGAPYADLGGYANFFEYYGEVYIFWGNTQDSLTVDPSLDASSDPAVTIHGYDIDDQIGGHITGNLDFDADGKSDIGIAGQEVSYLILGQARPEWESTVDLRDVLSAEPETRILKWSSNPTPNSMTIRLLDLDGDDYHDLVFGGYDNPGYPGDASGVVHAGQMWVTKGSDLWKHGYISANTTWSGNVFLTGDIVVQSGKTLTIAAGTDVWVWQSDIDGNLDGVAGQVSIVVSSGGSLVVSGTETDPVQIQSWTFDMSNDEVSQWGGVVIQDGASQSTIEHTVIRNGAFGIISASDVIVKNTTIEDCYAAGVVLAGGAQVDTLYMEDVVIRRLTAVENYGVYISGENARAGAVGCSIRDCYIGLMVDDDGRWQSTGLSVRNSTHAAADVTENAYALFSGGLLESEGKVLKISNGANVNAGLAEIKHGTYGIYIEKLGSSLPVAEFSQCVVDSNVMGVYVSEADNVEFDTCEIRRSDEDGISCVSGADITVVDCIISGNDATGLRTNNSDPDVDGNLIESNNGGITVENYGSPLVHRNKVWNNVNGIAFTDDGIASMDQCGGTCPPCGASNSFKGNTGYHLSNLTATTIDAECNYWGKTTPSSTKFYGPVDYAPYLSADPLPVAQQFEQPGTDSKVPLVYRLAGNSPNPFNPVTTIRYEVPAPGGLVQLRVYNVRGQLVRALVNGNTPPGYHSVTWDGANERGTNVSSGVYFLEMLAPHFRSTIKLVMLK